MSNKNKYSRIIRAASVSIGGVFMLTGNTNAALVLTPITQQTIGFTRFYLSFNSSTTLTIAENIAPSSSVFLRITPYSSSFVGFNLFNNNGAIFGFTGVIDTNTNNLASTTAYSSNAIVGASGNYVSFKSAVNQDFSSGPTSFENPSNPFNTFTQTRYVGFRAVAPTNDLIYGYLKFAITDDGNGNRAPIQLTAFAYETIPEPSISLTFIFGIAGLTFIRRRH
jgi:hypothetical protein